MEFLYKYKSFNGSFTNGSFTNESTNQSDEVKRSERILTQAQRESNYSGMPDLKKPDLVPTIVFTDVEGSSKMWADDPYTMMEQLKKHHELVVNLSEKNNGWVVKTIGDAFMVYFEPSKDSLMNGLKFSKDLILQEEKFNLRVGVCRGLMQQETYRLQKNDLKDFYGNAVNTASRMESRIADPNGIGFCAIGGISKKELQFINNKIGKVKGVDLSKYDLRGAKIDSAYKIKIEK